MEDKIILARIKKGGSTFEISVDPDLAIDFKEGKLSDISSVLHSEQIFSDAKKGQLASSDELGKVFGTTNVLDIAKKIILEGEIQVSAEHRKEKRDLQKRKLIELIHTLSINPLTKTPHPPARIETAIDLAKIHINEHKPIEEQLDDIIKKLRPHLPLSIEVKNMTITVKPVHIGKLNDFVRKNSKILKEEWDLRGNWKIKVEVPAGIELNLIDKLNSLTRGDIIIQNDE